MSETEETQIPGGDFRLFLQKIAMQGFYALGLIEVPGLPKQEPNPSAAQAVRARRAWGTQLAAATRVDEANARRATRRANDDAAGSLGGASSRRRSETVADALSKHGPETAGLSGAIGRRASPTNPEGERDGAEDER